MNNETMIDIKKNIRKQGRTARWVAEQLGKSEQNFGQQINHNPTINLLVEIANVIGCSVADIVADDDINAPKTHNASCPHCGKPIHISVKITD